MQEPHRDDGPAAAYVAPTGAVNEAWDAAHRRLTIGLLLTVSMTAFEALAVATTLPAAVEDIGGLALYGWAFSGFMLTNLVGISIAGEAADRYGVAYPFAAGSVLFAAGLVAAGLAPSMHIIVASRLAQGFGAGALSSVAYVAIARAYSAVARPRMLAMLSTAWVVPGLIGPAIAGSIADHLSWRWVFLGLAPCVAGAAGLAIPSLSRVGPAAAEDVEPSRTPSAIRLAAGTGLVLFALGYDSLLIAATCLLAGLVLGLPALRVLVPAGTLRARPGLPAAIATVGLVSFSFFAAEAFLPLSLTAVRGQSTTMAGITLTAATLTWTLGAWIQARLAHRRTRRSLTAVGLILVLAGIVATAGVLVPRIPAGAAVVSWGIVGLGMGLAYTTSTLAALECGPDGKEGMVSAAIQLASGVGVALGTGLGGAAIALTSATAHSPRGGIALVDAGAVAVAFLGLAAAYRLPRTVTERPRR